MYLKNSSKIISCGIMLSVAMIMTLPLCGFLFDCGCEWLWAEMDNNCNIHDLEKIHKCPWCQSMTSAIISISLSVISAVGVVYYCKAFETNNQKGRVKIICLYSILGLSVFFVVSFFTAWVSALSQNYPYFLF